MIELVGEFSENTDECLAARMIADALEEMWPGVSRSPRTHELIKIAPSVKLSGYKVSDVDVVVCAALSLDAKAKVRKFIPRKSLNDRAGKSVRQKAITVRNFVIAIEVKSHPERATRITGDNIDVKYKEGWKSATDQNIAQVHSLKAYFNHCGCDLYVHRCVIMLGLNDLLIGGAASAGFDGIDLLTSVALLSRVDREGKGYGLRSGSSLDVQNATAASIFIPITPTTLDRARMDLVATGSPVAERVSAEFGSKSIRLRGSGGSGKTIICLQAAWRRFSNGGKRTLVLTYNHALAADIRRLLALMKVPSEPDQGGIQVCTVMSFLYGWFKRLGVESDANEFDDSSYARLCDEAVELIESGAVTREDIDQLVLSFPDELDFDGIVVDEAQDWPQSEAELLKLLYGANKLLLADGVDQLVRGERCDWDRGIPTQERSLISLDLCLRLKRNLGVFIQRAADVAGVRWTGKTNNKAGGGRVLILKRAYEHYAELHGELVGEAKAAGNMEFEILHCVPYDKVYRVEDRKCSELADYIEAQGGEVWDGVDEMARKDFPRSLNQTRIVQYPSCRGLEGWIVVLHDIDVFWEEMRNRKLASGLTEREKLAFEDLGELASKQAWLHCLIALSRPIDRLVITIREPESTMAQAILSVAGDSSEFVEVLD